MEQINPKTYDLLDISPFLNLMQASLVAQMVKNSSAMRETWVQSLGWEDPLEKGTSKHFIATAWRIPGDCKEADTLSTFHSHFFKRSSEDLTEAKS